MNKKTILLIILSILATFAGFFWYFSAYIKRKTSSSNIPQTGNKDNEVDSIVINNLYDKVQTLIDRDLVIHVNSFALIPDLAPEDERIIVVAVDETKGNVKSTYLHDASGFTLISSQNNAEFEYVIPLNGFLNI
ncbi:MULTISPECIES: hypothetical protein [Arcicella]|uniref:Uncharacterized protein n=2 Tax=Arcicella TaxID=217140 RepID=A0ABU5SDY6_9BACT|nr:MULTISPECIES: hypothetical protein [unclassified Arcicella]MEA5402615.1 hypothetical protein [Arcicella sp. DC2W]MEA5425387.1 hypothetical protein [Arcicella sp. DC25W]